MKLSELEKQYGDYYVPAFTVAVGGQDLVRDLYLTVTSVEVDLKEKTPGRFSFNVANAFDWKSRAFVAKSGGDPIDLIKLFEFGSPVEIKFGYGDPSSLESMLRGMITEISTSYADGATPELSISGYDPLYSLVNGKNTRQWEGVPDSDAVAELVDVTGLSTDIRSTETVQARIDQSQEADIAFLNKLAERNGVTFYVRDDTFYFGPRNNIATADIKLPLGQGLLKFNPDANIASQVKTVEVLGRSAQTGDTIIGRASQSDASGVDSNAESGSERVAAAVDTEPVMRVRAAVHTVEEAQQRARAILEEKSQEFVTGDGESIGLPDILPDMNIELTALGAPFSKTYYVNGAKHKVDGSGYRTTFSVQETSV